MFIIQIPVTATITIEVGTSREDLTKAERLEILQDALEVRRCFKRYFKGDIHEFEKDTQES